MKIDIDRETIRGLFFLGILTHSDNDHSKHHVSLSNINEDGTAVFLCIDCDVTFSSHIIDRKVQEVCV